MDESTTAWRAEGIVTGEKDLEAEFEVYLRESSTLAFRVAYGVLRNHQDAEDVAQEAFARAHRKFRQLRDREKFRSWLVRMTWRLAIDRWRADRRRRTREEVAAPPPPCTTHEDVVAQERSTLLWRAIDDLPDKLRAVVMLAAIEEQNLREVARLLGVPEGTVKSRLFLARQQLAEALRCLSEGDRS
jgi:RNA polymerase sigma factor (sigma-70 family)